LNTCESYFNFQSPFWLQGDDSEVADESVDVNVSELKPSGLDSKVDVVSKSTNKSKKKKKKRGQDGSLTGSDKAEKPWDAILETLSLEANGVPAKAGDKLVKQCAPSVLRVDSKYLNAENELRRIFGSKVVKSFEKSNQAGSSRQIRGGRPRIHTHRKTLLVTPSDHWSRWDGSLSMEFLETRDGYHYFR
jgi:hypothetical protein